MEKNGFYKILLPLESNLFESLAQSAEFEDVGKGRKGNHLVDPGANGVPIVRTTTRYETAANPFADIHHRIIEEIKQELKHQQGMEDTSLHFNNALIEIYDHSYTKMNYHSDQALDLAANSWIALLSCYEGVNIDKKTFRKLKIQSKITSEEFEFTLENNSVILFSLETNARFRHKIILDPQTQPKPVPANNQWLGITFRESKTWIHFEEGRPFFDNGELLALADEDQAKNFYQLRGQENNDIDFEYPEIRFTLSIGDTLEPREN
jgi:hypothetical protein